MHIIYLILHPVLPGEPLWRGSWSWRARWWVSIIPIFIIRRQNWYNFYNSEKTAMFIANPNVYHHDKRIRLVNQISNSNNTSWIKHLNVFTFCSEHIVWQEFFLHNRSVSNSHTNIYMLGMHDISISNLFCH